MSADFILSLWLAAQSLVFMFMFFGAVGLFGFFLWLIVEITTT
jgi:hypothetical protein